MTQVVDFLWGSIQYEDFAFWGLIQRDMIPQIRHLENLESAEKAIFRKSS